jgi:RNA polymerase sigma-70 factor (ECF subfamily)
MDADGTDLAHDHDLLAAARAGDERAFCRLVGRHQRGLRSYCYLMLGCPHRADRVVRATVADAWHGRACADERASARIWLYRIATQACVDELGRDEVARPRSSNPPWS